MSSVESKSYDCRIVTGPLEKPCCFCRSKVEDEVNLGQVYESKGVVVHYYCLLTASSLPQNGEDSEGILGFYLDDIRNEIKMSATRICTFCKQKGASVVCCHFKCTKWFHLTCGKKNNTLHQFFKRFKSFCSNHRPKQRIDKSVENSVKRGNNGVVCPICYEAVVTNSFDTMWAPCCKKNAWFHRYCVQKLAVSAGYFFKCPLCNNSSVFRDAMLKFGIYIPQRDALWEQVPNAYEELLYQYRRCDAENCRCPRGRTHNGESNWELIRCKTCGSQGVHISCGRLKYSDPEWICWLCTDVLKSDESARKRISAGTSSVETASSDSVSGAITERNRSSVFENDQREYENSDRSDCSEKPVRRGRGRPPGPHSRKRANISRSGSGRRKPPSRSASRTRNVPSGSGPRSRSPPSRPGSRRQSPPSRSGSRRQSSPSISGSRTQSPARRSHFRRRGDTSRSNSDFSLTVENASKVDRNVGIRGPLTNISKPCPKRFKKNYRENDSEEESNANKTETSFEADTSVSLLKESKAPDVLLCDSESDEEIEVLEVHRVLDRKSLTANDGTELKVHPVAETKKVFYEILDIEKPVSSKETSDPNVLTSPEHTRESPESNSIVDSPLRTVDPKLFYCGKLPTSSAEKCDSFNDTAGGVESDLISGCDSNSETLRTLADGFKPESLLKPPLTVVPPHSSSSSHAKRGFRACTTVSSLPKVLPIKSSLETVTGNLTKTISQTPSLSPKKLARRDSIEEITIPDSPPPNETESTPSSTNHLSSSFQPKVVQVVSCSNLPSGPARSSMAGPSVWSSNVPQTGCVLNQNVLSCPTGVWLPPSNLSLETPILNLPPSSSTKQPFLQSTMTFEAPSKHSNEFSSGRRNQRQESDSGLVSSTSESQSNTATRAEQSNSSRAPESTAPQETPLKSLLSASTNRSKLSVKDCNTADSKHNEPELVSRSPDSSTLSPSCLRKKLRAGCNSIRVKVDLIHQGDPDSSVEIIKENTLDENHDQKVSIARLNRPCPKRFKLNNGLAVSLEVRPRTSTLEDQSSKGRKNSKVFQKSNKRPLCPKCKKPISEKAKMPCTS